MFTIQAKIRESNTDLDTLRGSGEIPAVFYGAGEKSTPISIPKIEFKKIWHKAGESSTVEVVLGTKKMNVLIHEVQTHPINDEPIHVDFLAIDMNKKIKVHVPLEFVGIAPAVKSGIGNLVKVLHEVEVEALPKDLPQKIEVDISNLVDTTSQISIAEIKVPVGVTLMNNSTDIVASIVAQKEEVLEDTGPVDLSAIEVEKKGKKEEEGEVSAEA